MAVGKTIFFYKTIISIHALREESDPYAPLRSSYTFGISIHALREESDFTNNMGTQNDLKYISIHALREESDIGKTKEK